MSRLEISGNAGLDRRDFLCSAAAAVGASMAVGQPLVADDASLAIQADGRQFAFDTGQFRGVLRSEGRSLGLTPVVESGNSTSIARGHGLFSHYRLLDAENRYGHGAWDWPSEARLTDGGAVEAVWSADASHPFDMQAVYRWSGADTLDVTTRVSPKRDLQRLEVFLASYFDGFPNSYVYVRGCPETGGKPGFLDARPSHGTWQMFPRDAEAVKVIQDGRWQRLPNPVAWKIMPVLAAPLAIRRDPDRNLTALVMAPPEDCFAVATPCNEEGHRSLYLSLIGRDLRAEQQVCVRSRLIIGSNLSDGQAVALYEQYVKDMAISTDKGRIE